MLDYCAEHDIVSDIELTSIDKLAEAYERVVKGDVKYRFVIDMATLPKRLDEERVEWRVERNGLGGAGEFSSRGVAAEDGDGRRVLIAAEKPLRGGVEGEVARRLATAGDALDEVELAVFGSDGEDDERVFAAVAGVEKEPIRGDGELSGCVFVCGKIGRDGLDGSVGVDQKALRSVGEACGRPEIVVEGGVDLVDAVDPAAVGMEGDVARTGAGVVVGEGLRIGELSGVGVDLKTVM